MKIIITALLMMLIFSLSAFARDSAWLICNNDYLVINVFEHRDSTGQGRETALKLLYGMHAMDGILIEDESDAVTLFEPQIAEETDNGHGVYVNSFIGTVHINYSTDLLLKGELSLYGQKHPLDTKLACKNMNPDLLPESKNK